MPSLFRLLLLLLPVAVCFVGNASSYGISYFCPTIIARDEWGRKFPRDRDSSKMRRFKNGNPRYIVVHHTGSVGENCHSRTRCQSVLRGIRNDHMDRLDWGDIGYNFLIDPQGNVYEGRGWDLRGVHGNNYNHVSIGISLLGNFDKVKPTYSAWNALTNLIKCAQNRFPGMRGRFIVAHRGVRPNPTTCPGQKLYNKLFWEDFRCNFYSRPPKDHPDPEPPSELCWA